MSRFSLQLSESTKQILRPHRHARTIMGKFCIKRTRPVLSAMRSPFALKMSTYFRHPSKCSDDCKPERSPLTSDETNFSTSWSFLDLCSTRPRITLSDKMVSRQSQHHFLGNSHAVRWSMRRSCSTVQTDNLEYSSRTYGGNLDSLCSLQVLLSHQRFCI